MCRRGRRRRIKRGQRLPDGVRPEELSTGLPFVCERHVPERSPGIGPWMSTFALIRGVGSPDLVPTGERRLEAAVAAHYGPGASLAEVSRNWAPFRSWVAFLLRVDVG